MEDGVNHPLEFVFKVILFPRKLVASFKNLSLIPPFFLADFDKRRGVSLSAIWVLISTLWYCSCFRCYELLSISKSKRFAATCYVSFVFKKYSPVEVIYLLIRCSATMLFLWNTNDTNRNGVIKTHTQIHQTLRER